MRIRLVQDDDAPALASLLNEVIARGGTTAFQKPFTPEALSEAMLTGPGVVCCFVAQSTKGMLQGFQTIVRSRALPENVGDIETFAHVDGTQNGIGSSLFEKTREKANRQGLEAINATIRADNIGGLRFYSRLGFVDYDLRRAVPLDNGVPVDRVSKRYQIG